MDEEEGGKKKQACTHWPQARSCVSLHPLLMQTVQTSGRQIFSWDHSVLLEEPICSTYILRRMKPLTILQILHFVS